MTNPRILVIGATGQIGWEVVRVLRLLGQVIAPTRRELDLADGPALRRRVRDLAPRVIVNAAAYTAVDAAERDAEAALRINGVAPGILAEEAERVDAMLLHYSTDYVFDGAKESPYTEEDLPNPVNVYGETKLAGERAIIATQAAYLIVRTAWVYGHRGGNFMRTVLRLAREDRELRMVDDQVGTPTWSRFIAEASAHILGPWIAGSDDPAPLSGLYHLTASGETTWHGFAKAILELDPNPQEQIVEELIPIPAQDYPTPARRPGYSVLDTTRLQRVARLQMPHWRDLLPLALTSSCIGGGR